ncbi:MAG TPA: four helix bundle protein [Steroidobacteraceae bacterium]
MRDHRRLEVFALADALALHVYTATRQFPEDERYGLTSQIRRAAVSIGANIVEGAARSSDADFLRLLTIAYGSARELEYEISLAIRLGYLPNEDRHSLHEEALRTCRALYGLILAIRG